MPGLCAWVCAMLAGLALGVVNGVAAEKARPDGRGHWAFQPLKRVEIPAGVKQDGSRTAVDRLFAEKLRAVGLGFSGEADRTTLIRRVALVVTGLPPTAGEVAQFVGEAGEDAYERMVERYLASVHFGERWAKQWLDASGYADSNGYFSADSDRPLAFRYRDYVIRSLNGDKPFDRFVVEQLAGDELAGWRPGEPANGQVVELLEATHFLRNGQDGTGESDGNPDEVRTDRYYALESAVQNLGASLLGMTVQCAKCHDHKFEPLTQRDYFSLQACLYPAFNIEKWVKPNDRVVSAALPGELERWVAQDAELNAEEAALRGAFAAWAAGRGPAGEVVFRDGFDGGNAGLGERWSNTAPGDDGPGGSPPVTVGAGKGPGAEVADGALRIIEGGGSGDRWLVTRQAFSWKPATTGEWIQATFRLKAVSLGAGSKEAERIGYFIAAHDFNDNSRREGGNILVDGHPGEASMVSVDYPGPDASGKGRIGTTGYKAGGRYGVRVTRTGPDEFTLAHVVDGVVESGVVKLKADELPDGAFGFEYCCGRSFVVDDVLIERSRRSDPEWVKQEAAHAAELAARRSTLETALKQVAARRIPKPGRIAWVSDMAPEVPEVRMLKRGNHKTPGAVVEPAPPAFLAGAVENRVGGEPGAGRGFPAVTAGVTGTTGRRRALAEWLVEPGSRQSALLARVTVNRIWQGYFGVGIVSTPENLGLSGAAPADARVLDWLAAELIDSGWQLKRVHRAILASRVFRQASVSRGEGMKVDPSNHLLWRYPMRRMDAEMIRDSMLAVSGRLGGKRSGPYVPTTRTGNGEVVVDEALSDSGARSIFLQQRRSQVATVLGVFDAPSIVFNCSRRGATTMPLQSLSLLNSEFAVRRAADLSGRLVAEVGESREARIRQAHLLLFGRAVTRGELTSCLRFLDAQQRYQGGEGEAERRAWSSLCQMLLASNEFLYIE